MKRDKVYKPKYQWNKKNFAMKGVIFELEGKEERNAIVMCHWPHCGMDAVTARRFANWLIKRADDLDARKSEG